MAPGELNGPEWAQRSMAHRFWFVLVLLWYVPVLDGGSLRHYLHWAFTWFAIGIQT